jgi:hypothetical protein
VVISDGVNCTPDMGILEPVLNQLRMQGIPCSFIHLLGGPFQPQQAVGMLSYSEMLTFVAQATLGSYLTDVPVLVSQLKSDCSKRKTSITSCGSSLQEVEYQRQMNIYHHALLGWSFLQRNDAVLRRYPVGQEDVKSSFFVRDPSVPFYRSIG